MRADWELFRDAVAKLCRLKGKRGRELGALWADIQNASNPRPEDPRSSLMTQEEGLRSVKFWAAKYAAAAATEGDHESLQHLTNITKGELPPRSWVLTEAQENIVAALLGFVNEHDDFPTRTELVQFAKDAPNLGVIPPATLNNYPFKLPLCPDKRGPKESS